MCSSATLVNVYRPGTGGVTTITCDISLTLNRHAIQAEGGNNLVQN